LIEENVSQNGFEKEPTEQSGSVAVLEQDSSEEQKE
jgi:hypothetical protein